MLIKRLIKISESSVPLSIDVGAVFPYSANKEPSLVVDSIVHLSEKGCYEVRTTGRRLIAIVPAGRFIEVLGP